MKKILSLLLVALMLVGMLPMNAIHAHAAATAGDSVSYTFSGYTAGTQYATNEEHVLDSDVTVVTTECHFTTQLRIYSSSAHDGYAIIKCTNSDLTFSGLNVNAGNKVDTLNVYGSNDEGATWTLIQGVSVTSTSYKEYTVSFSTNYKWLKLDVSGDQQVRVQNMTLSFAAVNSGDCAHTNTETIEAVAATCTTAGNTAGVKCTDCGATVEGNETIAALGHTNDAGVVTAPTCTEKGYTLYTCTVCGSTRKSDYVDATGHNYVDGVCSVCGVAMPTGLNGKYYIAAIRSSGNYMYMSNNLGTASTSRYQQVDSGLTELPTIIDAPVAAQVFELIFDAATATYKIKSGDQYLGWTSDNSGILVDEASAIAATIENSDVEGAYLIHFTASDAERYLALNSNAANTYFAWYKPGQVQDLYLVPVAGDDEWESEPDTTDPSEPEASEPDASEPATGSYQLVTDIADIYAGGQFVIVANYNGVTYAVPAVTSGKNLGIVVTISNDTVEYVEGTTPVWTIAEQVDGANSYISLSNGTNYLGYGSSGTDFSSVTTPYSWSVTANSDGSFKVLSKAAATRGIFLQESSVKFGAYSTSNSSGYVQALNFYKYIEAGTCEHIWGDWIVTSEPTCTEAGVNTATCTLCGETKTQTVAATGHTYTYVDGSMTCTCGDTQAISPISDAKAYTSTSTVYYVKGIVTYVSGKNVYIEDATGGICVYFATADAASGIALGDEIVVWDTMTTYNGLIETTDTTAQEYLKVSSGNALPLQVVTIDALLADTTNEYLSERVQIQNSRMGVMGTDKTALYDDNNKSINIYKAPDLNEDINEEDIVSVIAIVSSYNAYQLLVNPGTAATDVVQIEHHDPIVLETVTIAEAKAGEIGKFYQVEGVVTFIDGRNVYIQDATGGIVVYLTANATATNVGDKVRAYGQLKLYNGLIELDAVDETNSRFYEIQSSDNTVEAQEVTIEALNNDTVNEYLAEKITLKGVYVSYHTDYSATYGNVTYVLTDGNDNQISIYRAPVDGTEDDCIAGGTIVNVEAIVSSYNGYQLRIENIEKIEIVGTCAHETTELVNVKEATLTEVGYTGDRECTVCGNYAERGTETDALTDVEGWSLTLSDNILANFKIELDASVVETAQIKITVADKEYTYAAKEYYADGYCVVSAAVAAAQMTDSITVQIVNGDDVANSDKTYTIKGYAEEILGGEYDANIKALVTAMLHYGAAAQTYFSYNVENMANAVEGLAAAADPDLTQVNVADLSVNGSAEGIRFYGASLVFQNKIAVRFYFAGEAGEIEGAVQAGNLFYIEKANINPQDLDEAVTVTIGELSVSYSPMNYIVRMAAKGNANLTALVKALYNYNAAAEVIAPDAE